MQDVKMMAKMFAKYNTNEKAYFLLWAGQAMDRDGPGQREDALDDLGAKLALPEFEEATWLVREIFGPMDRAERGHDAAQLSPAAQEDVNQCELRFIKEESSLGVVPANEATLRVKAQGFDREDNNGEFDVDMAGQVKFTSPSLHKAVAAVDARYQAELLKAKYGGEIIDSPSQAVELLKHNACAGCGEVGDLHDRTCMVATKAYGAPRIQWESLAAVAAAYRSGVAKYGSEKMIYKIHQQTPPLAAGERLVVDGTDYGRVLAANNDGTLDVEMTASPFVFPTREPIREDIIDKPVCDECKGTGVYTSQVTGDVSACSQGCEKP